MSSVSTSSGQTQTPFEGFKPLTANFIYCPNQFFEVCLRHYSRGVVRLVGYMLRKTLGYLDKNGNPVRQDIQIPYSAISKYAGVSTRAIPKALEDAESGGFILCVTPGVANSRGQRGQAAEYRLRWSSEDDAYTDDPQQFGGFYVGDGHRSPIPNGYFDVVVRLEALAMAKVVGTVLRHTVGYQNQFGGRRPDAPLPYSYIQRFANVRDRTTLSKTLKDGTQKGYISCVSEGRFDPNAGTQSLAARYAVKWLDDAASGADTARTLPGESEHGKKPTGSTAETLPGEDGRNPTDRKTCRKNTFKQQHAAAKSYLLLQEVGFDEQTASDLAQRGLVEIQRQIDWLPHRYPSRNRLGLLRRAIEEDWSEPIAVKEDEKRQSHRQREKQEKAQQVAEEAAAAKQKRQRREHRAALLSRWRCLTIAERKRHHQVAIEQSDSNVLRRRLLAHTNLNQPPTETLKVMAHAIPLPVGESS